MSDKKPLRSKEVWRELVRSIWSFEANKPSNLLLRINKYFFIKAEKLVKMKLILNSFIELHVKF